MKPQHKLLAQMRDATRQLLGKSPVGATVTSTVTNTLQQALSGLLVHGRAGSPPPREPRQAARDTMRDINPPPANAGKPVPPAAPAFDPVADQIHAAQAAAQDFAQDFMSRMGVSKHLNGFQELNLGSFDIGSFGQPAAPSHDIDANLAPGARFIDGRYSNHAGSRDYKLYIPSGYRGEALPLVVMLHGCSQSPEDFAAGTQMNAVAEEKQCFVVYPAQTKGANSSKCWNWFNALDQRRDQGEPSLIAGIARQVMDDYPVDERQVYVAGLSAGGAMAVIVGTLYPELFAAVGVHSGLPFASAQDLPSALAAMKGGAMPGAARKEVPGGGIPIIVFHGDRDTTVHPKNGDELIAQGLRSQLQGASAPAASVDAGSVPDGHRYTRTTHRHADGSPLGEHWVIHGAGHAWSGGSQHGSYTDGKGPDASREMMRFFKTVS